MGKQFSRRLMQTAWVQAAIAWIAYVYMELVYKTSRWHVYGGEIPKSFWDANKPMIVCFWHNRMLLMCRCWRKGVKAAMLISEHRDGKLISSTIAHYGVGTVVGSTSRRSAGALREMMDMIQDGYNIGFTPDGPRGPRYRAAMGAVYLAKVTGLPLVSVSVATSRRKILRSWDRFLVCLPFSRGAYVWGKPIFVESDASDEAMESYRTLLEQDMIHISNQSDMLCGHAPIPPADQDEIRARKNKNRAAA